jgi:4-amino-4-deoxy-L-arabinose transferase-like glycosyltransferase
VRRHAALIVILLIAVVHGVFFIWYQRPDWNTEWSDQAGYKKLAEVLATTGQFTRYPDASEFVPEVLRTPMYPLFVAAIYKVAGFGQMQVALAQTALFALICLLVFAIVRQFASDGAAVAAAAATALFPPIPYFGALVLTEVWTTFALTLSIWVLTRAIESQSTTWFAAAGVMLAITALSRPVFVLLPLAVVGTGIAAFPVAGVTWRPPLFKWGVLLSAFAVGMLPWLAYNYISFGRFTISPAGGIGRSVWESQWQATWSGRLQNELTLAAEATEDRKQLDERIAVIAAREHLPESPMLEYVHQWQSIRRIWTVPTDPHVRVLARIAADQEYLRVGLQNLQHDSLSHLGRRLARNVFVLWAGEIPVRYSDINTLRPATIRLMWAAQALVCVVALGGLITLFQTGHKAEALLFCSVLLYVTVVHFPLFAEARLSLPAQPVVLLLASLVFNRRSIAASPSKQINHDLRTADFA